MPEVTTHAPGTHCWVDLMTPSPAEDAAFYTGLFGWSYEPVAGDQAETHGYGMFSLGGKLVAGITSDTGGMPPSWSTSIAVEDVAETAERVTIAGGAVIVKPTQVRDVGHMAVCSDPSGGLFNIWQPLAHKGAQLVNETGAMVWHELNARDVDDCKSFYAKVFGWQPGPAPMDNYTMFEHGGIRVAGMIDMDAAHIPAAVPPHWGIYFGVEDTDAAAAKTTSLGGGVVVAPFDIPVGRLAVLKDPVGALFNVVSMSGGTAG